MALTSGGGVPITNGLAAKSEGLRPPGGRKRAGGSRGARRGRRRGRKVGGVLNRARGLRRNEIVLELQNLRNVADRVAGLRIDRNAHQIVSGAVDQIAVGVDLEVAAAGVVGDAVEHRRIVDRAGRLLHREEAIAVDRHVGGDGRRGDGALRGDGLLREGGDATGDLPARVSCVRDEILEAGIDALVADGRGVRDVAGNVLQREGLRLQAAHRGIERVEDTHNIVSTFDPGGQPAAKPWPSSKETVASAMPK